MAIPLNLNPAVFLLLISIIISLATTLVYKFATDQALMKQIKEDTKKYQEQMKVHKDNPEKIMELQKQVMPLQSKMMAQSLKPMIITLVPFLLIFKWLGRIFPADAIIIPLSFWHGHLGWVGTYIIFSMIFTTLFRKVLKVVG